MNACCNGPCTYCMLQQNERKCQQLCDIVVRGLCYQDRPYNDDSTASRLLSEVKHHLARLVLRWGTTLESLVLILCVSTSSFSIENRSCLAWQKEKVTPTRRIERRSPTVFTGVLATVLDGRWYLLMNNAFLYIGHGNLLRWRFGLRRVSDTKFVGMWTHA